MLNKLILLFILFPTFLSGYVAPIYAQWAHHHVVWLNGKQQNQSLFLQMIDDYEKYGIKVGGALIDSAWATQFNNFQWDRKKFPHAEDIINKLHSKNIRVLLWVTSMINNDTKIYQEAKKNNYLLNHGQVVKWWHGHGAFLDYLNPQAVKWWHKLMDKVLDIGVDGFKCDGTDPISLLLKPRPYSPHAKRYIIPHQYGHRYYGDFYNYTKSKNPNGLIMSRPTDSFQNVISWNFSPRYVMFSGWVGDQDSTFDGLKSAMVNVIKSAWHGYLNFGFDISGYRGQSNTRQVFIRWAQIGALLPFMENGGNGRHLPWLYDQQTVNIYRKFVDLHYKLKPTFLSCASQKYPQKKSVITPLAKQNYQGSLQIPQNFVYLLCDNLLVAPIFQLNGQAQLIFPPGSNWIYYFDNRKIFKGGSRQFYSFNLDQAALFIKSNSVIVLQDEILITSTERNTKLQKTFIYGDYSEQFSMQYNGETMKIKIDRYYKNPSVVNEQSSFGKIRLIGFKNLQNNQNKQENTINIRLGTQIILQNIKIDQQIIRGIQINEQ